MLKPMNITPQRLIILAIFLTACSTQPIRKENTYSRTVSQGLYDMAQWSLEGRMVLTEPNDSWSANINWEHAHEAEEIKLSGPLGQGAVVIHLTGDLVTVARGGGDVQSSTQPEQFINQQVGVFVPVRSLRYWVVGLPKPDEAYDDFLGGFKQAGWVINYQQMQFVSGQSMPRKIIVMNDQVKLKIIIDQWVLNGIEER